MSAVKITSKGQVTIPKKIRDLLKSNTVEFKLIGENIVVKPVISVGGSLNRYARKYIPLKEIKEGVWEDVVSDRIRKKTT